jgi:hypothetical protein
MCQVTDLVSDKLLIPRICGSKHQRRAAVDKKVEEVRARKHSFSHVAPHFLTTCINSASLKVLDLSFNKLVNLPAAVTLASTVERLYINGNDLTELPPDLGNLRNLKFLDCSGNRIASLPPSVGRLTALETLRIGGAGCGNEISILPTSMIGLQELQEFIADNNQLTDITAVTQCPKLRILSLHANQLSFLPHGLRYLRNLRRLDVSNNCITKLSALVCATQMNLEYINLCNNMISSIPLELTGTCARVLLAGNPLLDVDLGPRLCNQRMGAASLLECALRAASEDSDPATCASPPGVDLPVELAQLLVDAPRCSLCTRKCLNVLDGTCALPVFPRAYNACGRCGHWH